MIFLRILAILGVLYLFIRSEYYRLFTYTTIDYIETAVTLVVVIYLILTLFM